MDQDITLSGSNTYTGSTTLSAGLISISATNNLGATGTADADNLIFNGGGLNSTGTFSLAPNKGMTLVHQELLILMLQLHSHMVE